MENLERILDGIDACKIRMDRHAVREWLFEYAMQTLEYEDKTIQDDMDYFETIISAKANLIVDIARQMYNSGEAKYELQMLPLKAIPEVVKKEHYLQ